MTEKEIKQMQVEIERLRADNARLQSEMIRLVSRNLDLSERLEEDVEMRRRAEVARMLMQENIERQRNADLQDDSQLMALIDLKLEEKRWHLNPDFDSSSWPNCSASVRSVSRGSSATSLSTIHRRPTSTTCAR